MLKIKSRLIGLLLFVILVGIASVTKPKLVKIKVNERITVFVPKGWRPMDGMDLSQRYPSVRAPLAAYTNEERVVDFSVNISATQWPDADLEMPQRFFKASIMNTFDRVEMIDEGIKEIKNKKYIFFEFQSRLNGNKQQIQHKNPVLKYTYLQYLVEPSGTLVFSFNCPSRMKDEWQETAREIMDAVKVK